LKTKTENFFWHSLDSQLILASSIHQAYLQKTEISFHFFSVKAYFFAN
jgi:hypothetical protein